jgi:hypothetical protein
VRAPSHLAHESLFLHLAAELAQRLLELLGVLDDYSHNPRRIQAGERGPLLNLYSRTSGRTVRATAMTAKTSA